MNLTSLNSQQGIGIIEVMVALTLLAVAVLGFSAMQLSAVKATDESLIRTRALAIMRGAAENMRGHASSINHFKTALNATNSANISADTCIKTACTVQQLAQKDAVILKQFASDYGISLGLYDCPSSDRGQVRQCMIASWDTTTATFGKGANHCADNTTGVQNPGATCFVMEAY